MSTDRIILYVEDDVNAQNSLRRKFRSFPYKFIMADSGEDALKKCIVNRFDLILLDIGLPGLNGFQILTVIKTLDAHIPVIILTGQLENQILYKSVLLGCNGFLEKPFDRDDLSAQIKNLIHA